MCAGRNIMSLGSYCGNHLNNNSKLAVSKILKFLKHQRYGGKVILHSELREGHHLNDIEN